MRERLRRPAMRSSATTSPGGGTSPSRTDLADMVTSGAPRSFWVMDPRLAHRGDPRHPPPPEPGSPPPLAIDGATRSSPTNVPAPERLARKCIGYCDSASSAASGQQDGSRPMRRSDEAARPSPSSTRSALGRVRLRALPGSAPATTKWCTRHDYASCTLSPRATAAEASETFRVPPCQSGRRVRSQVLAASTWRPRARQDPKPRRPQVLPTTPRVPLTATSSPPVRPANVITASAVPPSPLARMTRGDEGGGRAANSFLRGTPSRVRRRATWPARARHFLSYPHVVFDFEPAPTCSSAQRHRPRPTRRGLGYVATLRATASRPTAALVLMARDSPSSAAASCHDGRKLLFRIGVDPGRELREL